MLYEFIATLHPAQQTRMDQLLHAMARNRIDRSDYPLVNELTDCIAHFTESQIKALWSTLDHDQRQSFVWLVSIVCGKDTLSHVVKLTLTEDAIDRAVNVKLQRIITEYYDRNKELDRREADLTARETSYQNAVSELRSASARLDSIIDQL